MTKKIYLGMAVDFIHPGHINIINKAAELGEVYVGLLTDKAICTYKRPPILNFEQRKQIIQNIKGVSHVIPQDSADYTDNLRMIKPDIVVHGDDWKYDHRKHFREKVIAVLKEWDGKLVEPEHTLGLSSTSLLEKYLDTGTTPHVRRKKLRYLMDVKSIVRLLEVHNGLSGLIVEKTHVKDNGRLKEFDGMWLSSLTDSTAKGKPDTTCVDFTSRAQTIDQIFEVTTKPLVMDGDSGGLPEQFTFVVKTLERLGVSAVIIEDKTGVKRNSLYESKVKQTQDSIGDFCYKISQGKKAQITDDFMVIARIESLILNQGQKDALNRAFAYIEAGADAIMIHSKKEDPSEILEFSREYLKADVKVPLIAVPSTYCQVTESELEVAGIKIVIYANHLLRSAYPAMVETAKTILTHERAKEAESLCLPINDLLKLIGSGETP